MYETSKNSKKQIQTNFRQISNKFQTNEFIKLMLVSLKRSSFLKDEEKNEKNKTEKIRFLFENDKNY